jgi:hypothetical protein
MGVSIMIFCSISDKASSIAPAEFAMGCLVQAFRTFWILWDAVGQAEIVHSGIAGWPYPLGWMANLIAKLRRKKLLIIVESARWRIVEKALVTASVLKRLEASVYELLARYWCSRHTARLPGAVSPERKRIGFRYARHLGECRRHPRNGAS